jgi:hypothetical protein
VKTPPGQAVTGHPDSGLAAISSRHPAVGLAAGVVRDGRLRHFHAIEDRLGILTPIDPR